ncbi:DUF72 domain-containing protein [Promethearchaeum syntrophicum]|uniref:DUF72 domain-containing protein n=1 Tax=Promethearchaeum syntrophicum TaxID=2594042 RepID=A0A5B9DGW3_9ARCH|nr:DUF72 domain-containing protein [Candidatus Prometheoarchaeum syntrophicum]QEE17966.1 hypothetical protein DSAG12_03804 [Candidatus Prometheoarchaeum syntrophicum]
MESNVFVGCAGWSYKDWKGVFYPKTMQPSEYLSYYSKIFDFAEVNSTFYNIPSENTIISWEKKTPDNFRFSIKIWQEFTHKKRFFNINQKISSFFSRFNNIKHKISIFLLQFPPNFKYTPSSNKNLRNLLESLPQDYNYAVELRNTSWYKQDIINNYTDLSNVFMVLSHRFGHEVFYPENQKIQYLRMIGDRKLTVFNKIQRNELEVFEDTVLLVKNYRKSPEITDIFVIFNNHFRGFSPQDVNEFKKKIGLPYKEFNKQRNLFDYIH